jgi:predicted  nucleic acid-binding Zn-ribbon protein
MTRVADLYVLQEIDLEIQAKRVTLEDIEPRLGEREELDEARRLVEEQRRGLQEAQKKLREAEWTVDEVRAKVQPLNEKLYGGTIKNPKELVDIQHDVDSLKARQRELEDRVLEAMSATEDAEKELQEGERGLSDMEAQWQAEQESLSRQRDDLKRELQELEGRRSRQEVTIDAETIRQYDVLRAAHQGRAVAKVERGICQGCRITLPMHVLQKARRGNHLVQCTSCERILYLS